MSINRNLDELLVPVAFGGTASPNPTRPGRYAAPKGWEPGVQYDAAGHPETITTSVVPEASSENDYLDIVRAMGIQLPTGYTVRLLSASYDPAAWHRDEPGDDAVTRPVWRYKFAVVPASAAAAAHADEALLALIKKARPTKRPAATGDGKAFLVAYADIQVGKVDDAGGTAETWQRVVDKTDEAVARLKELRKAGRTVDTIYIAFLGDCVEGVTSQGGRLATRQDLAPSEQVRVLRHLITYIVKAFAPLADKVVVAAIPGNHDETTRQFASVQTDSWDLDVVASVQERLSENPQAFGHVSFVFPQYDRSTVTLDMAGTIVGLAHGHKLRGGAEKWWAAQAHGCQPIGEATLLITGHYHHLRVVQAGVKTWMQCPALDNGSRWFTETSGAEAPAGLLTALVGGGGWDDLKVL